MTGDVELAERMRTLEDIAGDVTAKRLQNNKDIRDWFGDEMRIISTLAQDMVESTGRQVRVV